VVVCLAISHHSDILAGRGKILLTRTEAAAKLGISERSLANLIAADKLTPYPERPAGCARMVYFLADDVESLRDERANNGW
jgi:hypothetical protein